MTRASPWAVLLAGVAVAGGCRDGSTLASRALNPGDETLKSAAAPDGKTVFLAGGGGSLRALDVATGRVRAFVSGAKACATPALSPDGKTLAVACCDGGQRCEIRLFDVDSGSRRAIPSPKVDLFPAWSRDGRRLYFLRAARTQGDGVGLPASDFRIMVHDVATGDTRAVGTDAFLDAQGLAATAKGIVASGSDPADYKKDILIAYEAKPDGFVRLWSKPLRTGPIRSATDGTLLAAMDPAGGYDYEVCQVAGGGITPITSLRTYIESFDPIKGGSLILLDSPTRDRNYRLLRIDEDGKATPIAVRSSLQ